MVLVEFRFSWWDPMNYYTPHELTRNYSELGVRKTAYPISKIFWLALVSGMIIAFGGSSTSTAVHAMENAGMAKTVTGLLFPFGLAMVILIGVELFTGNMMIIMTVLEKKTTFTKMLRNWWWVYVGNFVGSIIVAAGHAFFGQLNIGGGQLAVYTIKVASYKTSLPFGDALVLGILANVLVCIGVLTSYSGKDTSGRILGAYIPIVFFAILGYEHSIANMYYIPAGLFANSVPKYAALAAAAGIDVSSLTWGNFFITNLVPVTLGNIIGGVFIGIAMWYFQLRPDPRFLKA